MLIELKMLDEAVNKYFEEGIPIKKLCAMFPNLKPFRIEKAIDDELLKKRKIMRAFVSENVTTNSAEPEDIKNWNIEDTIKDFKTEIL